MNKRKFIVRATMLLIPIVMISGFYVYAQDIKRVSPPKTVVTHSNSVKSATKTTVVPYPINPTPVPAVSPAPTLTVCSSNSLAKLVIVSINKRQMWACQNTVQVYETAVITGMENLAADLTPVGTYHIYSKQTNLYLRGSDSTGSWNDYVYYWMPFLSNQYGIYGFHDATWRASSAFGNVSPYSSDASHGCVELPLAAASWLYSWASIGTAIIIER